jgi:DNA primase
MAMMAGTTDLGDFLLSIGVDVRRAGQEISARCPVHLARTGKEDNSPSWSMNAETGLWICYSCGARGTLPQLIMELTGKEDFAVTEMIMNNNVQRLQMPEWERRPEVDHQMYLHYPEVPKNRLASRNITAEAARKHGLRWNDKNNSWIIPMVSSEGDLLGWQEKGLNSTYNHPTGVRKGDTLFGIEQFKSTTAILVESPLDVVRFASSFSGIQCLGTFGAQITKNQLQLAYSVADKVIVAMDNDEAGIASAKKIFKDMPLLKGGVYWLHYGHTKAKDLGDMTDDEIEIAVVNASVIPWWL